MAINVPIVSQFVPTGIDKAVSEFKRLETTGQKVGFALEKAFLPAIGVLGGLAAAFVPAIEKASDLEESISKTEIVFGDAASTVQDFAKTAADSIGQSETAALNAAGMFGTFGKAAGLAGEDLALFSTDFITLASDLASFNNTTPEEAVNAIGAALRGESEPMRQFGVLLNDATLKAEAMSLGIYDGTGALTDQQKILAAQQAILKQTTDAQGDFARTSDGLANSQRTLTAQFENFQAQLGTALLPIVEAIMPLLIGMTDWAGNNTGIVLGIAGAVGALAAAVVGANIAMKIWNGLAIITKAVNFVLGKSFTTLWIATGVGIVIAIIGVIIILQEKFNILGKAVDGVAWLFDWLWDKAKYALGKIIDAINFLIDAWNKIPLLDDIPEISTEFLEMQETTEVAAEGIDNVAAVSINAGYQMAELNRQTGYASLQMEQALIPALDDTRVALDTAAWEVKGFYDQLDREDAFARFSESLGGIQDELQKLEPGSAEFEQKMRDAYRAVQELSDTLGYIPAELEKTLLYRIEIGDIAGAERLGALIAASDTYRADPSSEMRFQTAGGFTGSGATITNVNINMPAGSNGQDVIDAINRETRRTGQAQVPVGSAVRR